MAKERKNNFDLLRLALAICVFVGHSVWLVPHVCGEEWTIPFWLIGDVAVPCFFTISGYLIFASWERKPNLGHFAERRLLRIYPAYFVVVIATAFGGLALSSLPAHDYFSNAWFYYLFANLSTLNFLAKSLPDAFQSPSTDIVNGSLWTIKIELMFYAAVPVLSWFFRRWTVLAVPVLLAYSASLLWYNGLTLLENERNSSVCRFLATQLPGQLPYFLAGYLVYRYENLFHKYAVWLVALAGGGLMIEAHLGFLLLKPISIAIITLYFAIRVPQIMNLSKLGDLSYGIHLFHFPILHCAANAVRGGASPHFAIIVAAVAVFLLAFISWRLIEKPAMIHGASMWKSIASWASDFVGTGYRSVNRKAT
jgi:peptidoglycan/LPS O-acetylase OafA/YrhL